jgi:hypothetical protein
VGYLDRAEAEVVPPPDISDCMPVRPVILVVAVPGSGQKQKRALQWFWPSPRGTELEEGVTLGSLGLGLRGDFFVPLFVFLAF